MKIKPETRRELNVAAFKVLRANLVLMMLCLFLVIASGAHLG